MTESADPPEPTFAESIETLSRLTGVPEAELLQIDILDLTQMVRELVDGVVAAMPPPPGDRVN